MDLLARLGEIFTYEDLEAETKIVRGVPVRVATPRTMGVQKFRKIEEMETSAEISSTRYVASITSGR